MAVIILVAWNEMLLRHWLLVVATLEFIEVVWDE